MEKLIRILKKVGGRIEFLASGLNWISRWLFDNPGVTNVLIFLVAVSMSSDGNGSNPLALVWGVSTIVANNLVCNAIKKKNENQPISDEDKAVRTASVDKPDEKQESSA